MYLKCFILNNPGIVIQFCSIITWLLQNFIGQIAKSVIRKHQYKRHLAKIFDIFFCNWMDMVKICYLFLVGGDMRVTFHLSPFIGKIISE